MPAHSFIAGKFLSVSQASVFRELLQIPRAHPFGKTCTILELGSKEMNIARQRQDPFEPQPESAGSC